MWSAAVLICALTLSMLWTESADDELIFFIENQFWHFMQIVSLGDNLHEMSKPVF